MFKNKKYRNFITPILIISMTVLALVSVFQGFKNALIWSVDFQWSPVNLLASGLNPYEIYLDAQYDKFIATGNPVYYHIVYILLLPLGFLSRESAIIIFQSLNLIFVLSLYLYFSKNSSSKKHCVHITVAFLLLLSSTSFRVAMGNGQFSIFVLSCFGLFFFSENRFKYLSHFAAAVGVAKYSFAPNFLLHNLINKKYYSLFLIFIISIVSVLIFEYIANTNFLTSIFSPVEIWMKGDTFLNRGVTPSSPLAPGNGDLMSIMRILEFNNLLYLGTPVLASILLHLHYTSFRGKDALTDFSIVGLLSLMFYQHLFYDYVLLLPFLLLTYRFAKFSLIVSWLIIGYSWFSPSLFSYLEINQGIPNILFQFFLFICLYIILILNLSSQYSHESRI